MKNDLRTYYSFFRGSRKKILLSLALAALQMVTFLPIAFIVKYLFDHALVSENKVQFLLGIIGIFVLIAINTAAALWNRHVALGVIKSVVAGIRERLIVRSLALDHGYYTHEDLDRTHANIVQDTERIDTMTSAVLTQILPGIGIIVGLFFVLMYLNLFLVAVLVVALPFLLLVGRYLGKKVGRKTEVFHNDFLNFSRGARFVLTFNELIISSSAEKIETKKQQDLIRNLERSSKGMAWLATAYGTLQGNIMIFIGMCVLLVGGLQVIAGSISIGSLLSFYIAFTFLSNNVRNTSVAVPLVIEGMASLRSIMPFLREERADRMAKKRFEGLGKEIVFENVGFDYGGDFSLRDVALHVAKHDTVGIFGASGAGKSTLISLLLGFHSPKQGTIRIDGHDIASIDLPSLRNKVGFLPQEPLLFPGTILENLTYGLPDVDMSEIETLCKELGAHDFIAALRDGYKTEVGNRGSRLSGGQRQRLAIARALLRKPDILIMDEPDKNLDDTVIFDIVKNIKAKNVTLFIVSHHKGFHDHVTKSFTVKDGMVYNTAI